MEKQVCRVAYIARCVPHYRESLLRQLAERVEFRVLGGGASLGLGERPPLDFERHVPLREYRSPFGRGKFYWQSVFDDLRDFRPDLVISEFGISLLHVPWLLFRRRGIGYRLAFWTHGLGVGHEGPATAPSDRVRIRCLKSADGLFYYTEGCRRALSTDLQGSRVPSWIVWNTLDSDEIENAWERLSGELESEEPPYACYIGRLVDEKRVGELVELAQQTKSSLPQLRWKVVGDGPLREALQKQVSDGRVAMEFLGPITDCLTKGRILKNSVAMVCPGMLGLNVVDALGFGCPVISYATQPPQAKHSPEVEYLKCGRNGWLVDSSEALVDRLGELMCDPGLREQAGRSARDTFISECRIARQLDGFLNGIQELCPHTRVRLKP